MPTPAIELDRQRASDEQAVAAARAGDAEAFAELVERYSAPTFRLALSVLGPGREPDAEDVAQEVFLRVHRNLDRFSGRSRFATWLYRVTYRAAIDRQRQDRARRRLSDTVSRDPATPTVAPRAGSSLRGRAVRKHLRSLPDRFRSAIYLHYWLGYTVTEIAELMTVPAGTVKVYLHRGRQRLLRLLEQEGTRDDG